MFLIIELVIALIAGLSSLLLFIYFDPSQDLLTASILMGTALFLALSSWTGLILYFIKKILLRGDVSFWTAVNSWRQGVLISVGILTLIAFRVY